MDSREDSFADDGGAESDDSFNDDPEWGDEDDDGVGDADSDDDMRPKQIYRVLKKDSMQSMCDAMVDDLMDKLCCSKQVASTLLRLNGWKKEKVETNYFDNTDKLLRECGLLVDEEKETVAEDGTVECRICDDDVTLDESHALACGHRFCNDCWKDYLEGIIMKGKQGISSRCPSYQCTAAIDDETVQKHVAPESWEKFQFSVLRSLVEDNPKLRWCPAPGCEHALEGNASVTSVTCACGYDFCFQCGEEEHRPISCPNLATWLDKCRNESETAHWIMANTKKCPKCMTRIEKNQGCNHMTCRTCEYDFCWICMGKWEEHGNHTGGFYKCNRYDPKKIVGEGDEQKAKQELDRYLHYYQRYHNHDQSKRFAQKQRATTEKRMTELQQESKDNATWMDVQFLLNALEQVFQCRQVLKHTYAFGYYLKEGPEKELFEYLQQELERNTEHLSELSEKPLKELDRQQVVNFTRVTNQFLQNLLDGVTAGLTGA